MQKFKPLTAVITGAANGIGKALSIQLASGGCHLALMDIDEKRLEDLKNRLDRFNVKISIHIIDITNASQIKNAAQEISRIHDTVNLLINSAGISVKGILEKQSIEDIELITRINYLGPIFVCREMTRLFDKNQPGRIVNISSGAGLQGFANRTTYCASKFGLKGFSEALRAELYKTGIRVSCVFPGPVDTAMYARSRYVDENERHKEKDYLQKKGIPPEKVAKAILKACLKGKPNIVVGFETKLMVTMKRLMPHIFSEFMHRNQDKLPV